MDEVITYVSTCRRKGYGTALYNFLHALSETVTAEPNVVLVASIPASELEYTAEDIADEQRFKKMLDRRGKAYVMSAESETAEIIRRRLFEWDLRSVGQHGRAAVARSQARGRVAIVIADNLRTHTAAGSRLVRQMLAELHGQLYLVYTPAYDPDANRIEWLWRISRRAVSHNHQREIWDELQADIVQHFILLSEQPDVVLRHLGSAFAEEWGRTPAVCSAA